MCKHSGDHVTTYLDLTRGQPTCIVHCDVCQDCGAWLSLGPSNDDSEAVRVEMRAAELAADLVDDDHKRTVFSGGGSTSDECWGWFLYDRYISANDVTATHVLSDAGLAGYLARCIATHGDP